MKFIGVDLHKKTISLCVVLVVGGKRKVVTRRRFDCQNPEAIRGFLEKQGTFQAVVEATASYEWFLLLIEDLADRCVLAHPKKLRVIAECKHNSDIAELFTLKGEQHLADIAMSRADRCHTTQMLDLLHSCQKQFEELNAELRQFTKTAPGPEREARAVLDTLPEVGTVTIDIVLSELGDWRRFRNAKQVDPVHDLRHVTGGESVRPAAQAA